MYLVLRRIFICLLTCASLAAAVRFPDGADSVRVPLLRAGHLLVVAVDFPGHGSGHFLVDTGGQMTMANATVLTLPTTGHARLSGVGGQSVVPVHKVDEMRLGAMVFTDHQLISNDLARFSDMLGVEVGGVLGADVFAALPFTIDYAAPAIVFHKRSSWQPPDGATKAALTIRGSRPYLPVRFGKALTRSCLLDTAATRPFYLPAAVVEAHADVFTVHDGPGMGHQGAVGGGSMATATARRVTVFGQTLNDVQVQYTAEAGRSHSEVLGAPILEHFDLSFDYQNSALYYRENERGSVAQRLDAGMPVDAVDWAGLTALALASNDGRLGDVTALIAAGAEVDRADKTGRTPLFLAAQRGELACVTALLAAGADPALATAAQLTPLHAAAKSGHTAVVATLIDRGVAVDTRASESDNTPLMDAAVGGHLEVVQALLAAGADASARNAGEGTVLMAAVQGGDPAVARTLIKAGAPLDAIERQGLTALMLAAYYGKAAAAEALIAAGADMTVTTEQGYTALKIARGRKQTAIAAMLEQAGAAVDPAQPQAEQKGEQGSVTTD